METKLREHLMKRAAIVPDAIINQLAAEQIINHYLRTAPLPDIVEHWAEAKGLKKELPEEWLEKLGDLQAAAQFNELF